MDEPFDVRVATPQVILFSADVERAATFYRRLGFREVFRIPETGTPIHVDLELDGYRIGFASEASSREDHGLEPAAGQRATVTLWTEDVAATFDTLAAAGVRTVQGPEPYLDRLLLAWVSDPDGHPVQLVQVLDGR